jgi:hypothetical protein
MKSVWSLLAASALVAGCGGREIGTEPDVLAEDSSGVIDLDVDADGVAWASDRGVFRVDLGGSETMQLDPATEACGVAVGGGAVYVSEYQRVRRVDVDDGSSFGSNQVDGCARVAVGDDLVMGFGLFSGGALAWAPVGATNLEPGASVEVDDRVLAVAGDEAAVYFAGIDPLAGTTNDVTIWRMPRDGSPATPLAPGRRAPRGLIAGANELYWSEHDGTVLTIVAVSKDGGSPRTVAIEERGCGLQSNLALWNGFLYFGSSQAPPDRGCGADNPFTISRVPIAGGAIQDVVARHSMRFASHLRAHDGAIYFSDGGEFEPAAIKSVAAP